jgi:hypothetical protein
MRQYAVLLVLAACGGATTTEFFGGGDASTTGGGGTDATVEEDSGQVEEDGGTILPDTGTVVDAAKDTGKPDTGTSLSDGIQCHRRDAGVVACTPGLQTCCITSAGTGGRNFDCRSTITPVACLGVDLQCDDQADCADQNKPGQLCCARLENNRVVAAACAEKCAHPGTVVMCDPREADPCPNGGSCQLSTQSLPDYYLCR